MGKMGLSPTHERGIMPAAETTAPMSMAERSRRGAMRRSINARRRRFQRYVTEMRDSGLVVCVREELADGSFRDAPEYTPEAAFRAIYHH